MPQTSEPTHGSSPAPTGIRAFFIRHETFFAITGALIVFIAFFTKEALRENLIEIDSALEQALFAYELQDQFAMLQRQLDYMDEENDPAIKSRAHLDDARLTSVGHQDRNALAAAEHVMKDAEDLLVHLPKPSSKMNDEDAKLQAQLTAAKTLDHQVVRTEAQLALAGDQGGQTDTYPAILALKVNQTKQLDAIVIPLEEAAFDFEHDVVVEAQGQKALQDRDLHRATIWMYVLFAFGWLLGLLGKVLKLQSLAGSEAEG